MFGTNRAPVEVHGHMVDNLLGDLVSVAKLEPLAIDHPRLERSSVRNHCIQMMPLRAVTIVFVSFHKVEERKSGNGNARQVKSIHLRECKILKSTIAWKEEEAKRKEKEPHRAAIYFHVGFDRSRRLVFFTVESVEPTP